MIRIITFLLFSTLILFQQSTTDEIDAIWAETTRTVQEGDFEGYAALYHDEAVLVNGISETSVPISVALDGWRQGFDDTKAGKMSASVEFRFTKRIHDETTAHDTGIFRYSYAVGNEEPIHDYVHFQALFIQSDGSWKMVMEYQVEQATKAEWDAIL